MKPLALVLPMALLILVGCTPSETYKPAEERQYESADPPAADSAAAPSDSTASTEEEEEDNTTEEVIIRSL